MVAVDARLSATSAQGLDVGSLFDRYGPALLRYLTQRVGPTIAEDLVGDTFEVLLENRSRYDPERGTERSWLFGIATNLLFHHLRRGGRERVAAGRLAQVGTAAEDLALEVAERVDAARRIELLATRIDSLAAADREVLLLIAWADLTPTEVAAALGTAPGTVRSRLHRARQALRGDERVPQEGHE